MTRRAQIMLVITAALALVLGYLYFFRNDDAPPEPNAGSHWHAAFGVNVCGKWLRDAPEFERATYDRALRVGVHSHGDGLIHIHPRGEFEAGARATLGTYFDSAGFDAAPDAFELWDGIEHRNGDRCPDGRRGTVRWAVDGVEREGDPSDLRLADGQVIALAFLPADEEVEIPPASEALLVRD